MMALGGKPRDDADDFYGVLAVLTLIGGVVYGCRGDWQAAGLLLASSLVLGLGAWAIARPR